MSRPLCSEEITETETTPDQITVAIPYEAVVDLIELLGLVAAWCCDQQPVICSSGTGHTDRHLTLAAQSTAMAWALAATVWPGPAGEPIS
jgi:hypothetical protein